MDDVFVSVDAFRVVMDDVFASIDALIIVIDDVFASIDALMIVINEELLKLVTVESIFVTDVLRDKTGCMKYLFNKYIESSLRLIIS